MRILVASDSFKDGCSSIAACEAIAKGIQSINPDAYIDICPISDGGEGTVEILKHHLGGELVSVEVANPLFKRIQAKYLLLDKHTAFIEMAQASGLELLHRHERNPMNTSSFGTGELIKNALDHGCKEIIVSVGGSATNDLGFGLISALGGQFINSSGNIMSPIGYNMANVSKIDLTNLDPRITEVKFTLVTDVQNVLYGPNGAAHVFAKQKGASDEAINHLDRGLQQVATLISKELNIDVADFPGSGAAGGIGAGCVAFLNAEIQSGFSKISSLISLNSKIQNSDLIITGEGHLDNQTMAGKVIKGVTDLSQGIPIIAFCGKRSLSNMQTDQMGINQVIEINDHHSEAELEFQLALTTFRLEMSARKWMNDYPIIKRIAFLDNPIFAKHINRVVKIRILWKK